MQTNWDNIISHFHNQYKRILYYYYPAHESTGFTERNLSVNFARAVESTSSNAFTWYEVPLDRKVEHYDAMVVNVEAKEIYIIESKRFSVPLQKLREVGEDIQRITDKKNLAMVRKELKLPDYQNYTVYGVIVADIWLEAKSKEKIYQHWNNTFVDAYPDVLSATGVNNASIKSPQWFTRGFDSKDTFEQAEKYKLLVMIFELGL